MAWRRQNKKGQKDEHTRASKRRTQKFGRAVGTVTVDEIRKRRQQKPEFRAAAREAALREVKDRAKKKGAKKSGGKKR